MHERSGEIKVFNQMRCLDRCYYCGGWGGKVLGMLTGGLIGGGQQQVQAPKVAEAPLQIESGEQAIDAQAKQRKKVGTQQGYSSTFSAGNTSGGGSTGTRSLLGG